MNCSYPPATLLLELRGGIYTLPGMLPDASRPSNGEVAVPTADGSALSAPGEVTPSHRPHISSSGIQHVHVAAWPAHLQLSSDAVDTCAHLCIMTRLAIMHIRQLGRWGTCRGSEMCGREPWPACCECCAGVLSQPTALLPVRQSASSQPPLQGSPCWEPRLLLGRWSGTDTCSAAMLQAGASLQHALPSDATQQGGRAACQSWRSGVEATFVLASRLHPTTSVLPGSPSMLSLASIKPNPTRMLRPGLA